MVRLVCILVISLLKCIWIGWVNLYLLFGSVFVVLVMVVIKFVLGWFGFGYWLWGFRIIKVFVILGGIGLVVILVVFSLVNILFILLNFRKWWFICFCIFNVWFRLVLGMCSVWIVILFLFNCGMNLVFSWVVRILLVIINIFVISNIGIVVCRVIFRVGW